MTCADARALASLALDGELDELGSRQLRGHLASCRDCTRAVGKMRLASELLRSAPRAGFRCELGRGQLARACSSGTGGRIWAGAAMTLVALVLATGALPGRDDTTAPSPRAVVVAPLALPIGQRSAMDDFAPPG
ncbi:MAG TPA: zf-HC2 domain-containing protein [Gaiella sp.]|nr:zf-HC2 domain-containing protein [Gaiella sp.]